MSYQIANPYAKKLVDINLISQWNVAFILCLFFDANH